MDICKSIQAGLKTTRLVLLLLLCTHSAVGFGQVSPLGPADSLQITTWNLYLLPRIAPVKQMKRADSIVAFLLDLDSDVLVLQELFHKKASQQIVDGLMKRYPHQTGIPRGRLLKASSGVAIFSKYPIGDISEKTYSDCAGPDCLSAKGVYYAEVRLPTGGLSLYSTHCQSGGGSKKEQIRIAQFREIKALRERWDPTEGRIEIFAGDLNASFGGPAYDSLISLLGLDALTVNENIPWTYHPKLKHLQPTNNAASMYDYLLIEEEESGRHISSWMDRPTMRLKNKSIRLSDHYPLTARIRL